MSPAIQNDAFKKEELDAVYLAFHVKPDGLADAVKGMKALGVLDLTLRFLIKK